MYRVNHFLLSPMQLAAEPEYCLFLSFGKSTACVVRTWLQILTATCYLWEVGRVPYFPWVSVSSFVKWGGWSGWLLTALNLWSYKSQNSTSCPPQSQFQCCLLLMFIHISLLCGMDSFLTATFKIPVISSSLNSIALDFTNPSLSIVLYLWQLLVLHPSSDILIVLFLISSLLPSLSSPSTSHLWYWIYSPYVIYNVSFLFLSFHPLVPISVLCI